VPIVFISKPSAEKIPEARGLVDDGKLADAAFERVSEHPNDVHDANTTRLKCVSTFEGRNQPHKTIIKFARTQFCRIERFYFEARMGLEPTYNGFANHCLTAWLPRQG
jgi:hypothetical protein